MAANVRGLGRGLDALLGGARQESAGQSDVVSVALSDIRPNPHQPRLEFESEALEELASSIRSQGVLQPVLVRPAVNSPGYELVAGERRCRAAKMAGLTEIPALVKELTDAQSLAIALIENLQREDLNPIEEALGYQRLKTEFGLNQEALAKQMGKSRSALANILRLLVLPPEIQAEIRDGALSAGHGRVLLSLKDEEVQGQLWHRIKDSNLTVRQAEAEAGYWKKNGELPEVAVSPVPAPDKGGRKKGASDSGMSKEPVLDAFRERLSEVARLRVSIMGGREKGKVVLHYADTRDLKRLAALFNVPEDIIDMDA